MSNQEKNNTNPQGENTQGNGNNTQEAEKVGFFTRIGSAIDNWAKRPIGNTIDGVKKAGGWMKDHPVQTAIGGAAIGYAGYKAYQHFHNDNEEEEDETVEVVELPVVPALPEPPVVPQIEEHTEVEVPELEENPTEGVFNEAEI